MEWFKLRFRQQTNMDTSKSWSKFFIRRNIFSTRTSKSYYNSKRNKYNIRYRYNKYFQSIKICLISILSISVTAPVIRAETVGGVSATANPIANSSGSVTNQAIQVLQGPYITNTYGGGVQCQGATMNITPVSYTHLTLPTNREV